MSITPKFVGYVDIPTHLKDYGNSICRRLVHEIVPGKALLLELERPEAADHFQRSLLNAGVREFGAGHIQTATEGSRLYVWLRSSEPDPLEGLLVEKSRIELDRFLNSEREIKPISVIPGTESDAAFNH